MRRNNKSLEFKYEEDEDSKEYGFYNDQIILSFEKKGNKNFLNYISIFLSYEDILENSKILKEIKDIMELKKLLDKIFYKK